MTTTAFSTKITVDGKPVIINVPRGSDAWRKANSLFCPLGPAPTQAWFLMLKGDLDELDMNTAHTVRWTEEIAEDEENAPTISSNVLTFPGLYIVNASRLLPGGVGDLDAAFLVEFSDARLVAARKSDTQSVISNIRSYANEADFLPETTQYDTWNRLVEALWTACGLFGSYPGLPVGLPIDGVPQNTWLIGLNAYRALTAVLEQLDCALNRNPLTNVFTIVQLGSNQNVFPAGYSDTLRMDYEPVSSLAVQAAAELNIYFVFHRKSYGQERDTELTENWAYNGEGNISNVETEIDGAYGTVPLWDDLPWILDENNQQTNSSEITARAANRKSRYVTRWTVTPQHRVHRGLRTEYLPGGQVRATLWRNWADGEISSIGGTVTEFVCCSNLIVGMQTSGNGVAWLDAQIVAPEREQYGPPDLGRRTYPNYPRLANIVQVSQGSGDTGATLSPDGTNANGVMFHSGKVKKFQSGGINTLDDCWILFVDDYNNLGGNIQAIQGEFYGPARLSGMTTCGATLLPVYVLKKGGGGENEPGTLAVFQLTALSTPTEPILDLSGNCLALLLRLNNATGLYENTGTLITVVDFYLNPGEWQGMVGYQGLAVKRSDKIGGRDAYTIVWMERPALLMYGQLSVGKANTGSFIDEPDQPTLNFYQQGEKQPPYLETAMDPGLIYPMTLGPANLIGGSQTASEGAQIIATWNDREKLPHLLVAQQQTFYARGVLKENLKPSDPITRVIDVKTEMFSPFNLDPKDNLEAGMIVRNEFKLIGVEGTGCLLLWLASIEAWTIITIDPEFNIGFVSPLSESEPLIKINTASNPIAGEFTPTGVGGVATDCYIRFVDFSSAAFGSPEAAAIVEKDRNYFGKLVDFHIVGGEVFPLYDTTVGEQEWECTRATDLAKGVAGEFTIIDGTGTETTITLEATPRWKKFKGGKKGILKRLSGKFVVGQLCEGT